MTIGILTFNRTLNYGAILQCYALQKILQDEGNDVKVIDYKQPYIEIYASIFSWKYVWKHRCHLGNIFRYIKSYNKRKDIYLKFLNFKKKYINCTKACNKNNIPKDFDIYVIGSDQLWTREHTGGIFDEVFLGFFKRERKSKVFSYAISCNNRSVDALLNEKNVDVIKNFQTLSFREEYASIKFSKAYHHETRIDLDPTLLAKDKIWDSVVNDEWLNKKYIAVYQARTKPGYENAIEANAIILAKKMNVEVINLSSYKYTPEEFVSIIKYAICVFTSSFHGLAFSLVFNKPFYVFTLDDGHDGRCISLLNNLGITDNIVSIKSQVTDIKYLDYKKINFNLDRLRENSMDYIRSIK